MVSVNEGKKCLVKSGKDTVFSSKVSIAKYLKINAKVSKDKWQSMFRYFVKYVKTFFFIFLFAIMRIINFE